MFRILKALALLGLLGAVSLGLWVRHADWPNPKAEALPAKMDVMVVLGGGGQERVREACRLYKEGRATQVIVTGDGGLIMTPLIKGGIPESALIYEPHATTTLENAEYVKPLLEKLSAKSVILVTSWTHARRAERIFASLMPTMRFYTAFEKRPVGELPIWEKESQQRERRAALYCLVRHGIWCF